MNNSLQLLHAQTCADLGLNPGSLAGSLLMTALQRAYNHGEQVVGSRWVEDNKAQVEAIDPFAHLAEAYQRGEFVSLFP